MYVNCTLAYTRVPQPRKLGESPPCTRAVQADRARANSEALERDEKKIETDPK